MALFKSQIATEISGSVGGTTYGRSRNGLVMRARSVPVKTNTPQVLSTRDALTRSQNLWRAQYTATNRAGWDLYAANVPLPNALGDARQVSGFAHAMRVECLRYEQGIVTFGSPNDQVEPPKVFDLGSFTDPTGISYDPADNLTLTVTPADGWAQGDDGGLMLYMSRGRNQSRKARPVGFRLAGCILGTDGGGIDPLQAIDANEIRSRGIYLATGQQWYLRVVAIQIDGRCSRGREYGPFTVL